MPRLVAVIGIVATFVVVAPCAGAAQGAVAEPQQPLLLQRPAVSRTLVAFTYGGDLWTVPRAGGDARRLTSAAGTETDASFSPDGSLIAFTGAYDGNVDVYVIPATGGEPTRLTYHPGNNVAVGWSPDGKWVLFRSSRDADSPRYTRLFRVGVDGGFPQPLDLPSGYDASYAPSGDRLAYLPIARANEIWKRYRGGRTTPIWIVRLADASVDSIPRANSNDFNPMWVGDTVYFLSDRDGANRLYAYDTRSHQVSQLTRGNGLDIKSAAAGAGAIVYDQFGTLHVYDLADRSDRVLTVRIADDLPSVRPHFEPVANAVASAGISPTGQRAVFGARGDVLTVPAEKGSVRNLTNSSGAADRDPAWSPDGQWIAYFSDRDGEYALYLSEQHGTGDDRKIILSEHPTFYYSPTWSPDSRKIAYFDNALTLWYTPVAGKPVAVDHDTYETPQHTFDPVWSPDSRWLAYTKLLPNHLHAVMVFDATNGQRHQVTDGMSDARYPVFDRNGKYLYFTASTDAGPSTGWLDMTSYDRPTTRSAYVVVLRKDLPSPLAPESDEEKPGAADSARRAAGGNGARKGGQTGGRAAAGGAAPDSAPAVRIDFNGIDQRILALPIPARDYSSLQAGTTGMLYLVEDAFVPVDAASGPPSRTVHRFDLSKRKTDKLLDGVSLFQMSFDGQHMLYRQGRRWAIASAREPIKPGEGTLNVSGMEVRVDPRAEWKQMYDEVWRIERDFFYDPNYHGLDLTAAKQRYQPYLGTLSSRGDLTYLFDEMLGELTVGHLFVSGGDNGSDAERVGGGLLGADYAVESGRYRFTRVYGGENWNPELRAPLTQPGVNVRAGEYLLAVDGRDVRPPANLYGFFENTAGKQVTIRVGPNPDGTGARDVVVVPVGSEAGLRNLAWIERNRRAVDSLSKGRVAYVYLPNTGGQGYTNFNRYYFAQLDRDGAVLDERFNGGGSAADYMIDVMHRPLLSWWDTRHGQVFATPVAAIRGPKAMIINQYAGSGGDALPWYFHQQQIGPLVGKRTWGGLVGIYDYPTLIDGGSVTAPRVAFFSPKGEWDVENHGVAPDIEVEMEPSAWRAGHDPQLEKAVAVVLDELRRNPPPQPHLPAYPNYHTGTSGTP